MPLLPLEPYLYPENLLDASSEDVGEQGPWWVLHTRPRTEKALSRRLLRAEVPFFLPLYEKRLACRGRRLRSFLPLFPGYVFLRGGEEARIRALETNMVARVIPVVDQADLQQDLERVYQVMVSGAPLTPENKLLPGRWVRITAGPLAGLEGKVLRRGSNWKILIEVRMLQQGVSVELDEWAIEPIECPEANGLLVHATS